jgi:hypothetical protein
MGIMGHPDRVVGKFGVGLKDALATFDRHRIDVTIRTRYGDITTGRQAKHGFSDIKTLHALISDPADPGFSGTEFILHGNALSEVQVEQAKALFLHYAGDEELDATPFGTVLRPRDKRTPARIYVNGLRVAEEENFLFSYNITSPTRALRRALKRERSNVGRGAYTDRVKSILLACEKDEVIEALVADLQNYERGTQHDETQWLDVGLHACKLLNARRKVTRPEPPGRPSRRGSLVALGMHQLRSAFTRSWNPSMYRCGSARCVFYRLPTRERFLPLAESVGGAGRSGAGRALRLANAPVWPRW